MLNAYQVELVFYTSQQFNSAQSLEMQVRSLQKH